MAQYLWANRLQLFHKNNLLAITRTAKYYNTTGASATASEEFASQITQEESNSDDSMETLFSTLFGEQSTKSTSELVELEYFKNYPAEIKNWVFWAKRPIGSYDANGTWVPAEYRFRKDPRQLHARLSSAHQYDIANIEETIDQQVKEVAAGFRDPDTTLLRGNATETYLLDDTDPDDQEHVSAKILQVQNQNDQFTDMDGNDINNDEGVFVDADSKEAQLGFRVKRKEGEATIGDDGRFVADVSSNVAFIPHKALSPTEDFDFNFEENVPAHVELESGGRQLQEGEEIDEDDPFGTKTCRKPTDEELQKNSITREDAEHFHKFLSSDKAKEPLAKDYWDNLTLTQYLKDIGINVEALQKDIIESADMENFGAIDEDKLQTNAIIEMKDVLDQVKEQAQELNNEIGTNKDPREGALEFIMGNITKMAIENKAVTERLNASSYNLDPYARNRKLTALGAEGLSQFPEDDNEENSEYLEYNGLKINVNKFQSALNATVDFETEVPEIEDEINNKFFSFPGKSYQFESPSQKDVYGDHFTLEDAFLEQNNPPLHEDKFSFEHFFKPLNVPKPREYLPKDLVGHYRFGITQEEAEPLSDKLKNVLSFKYASNQEIFQFRTQRAIKKYQRYPTDTGSAEVQAVVLCEKMRYFSDHFKKHKQDKHSLVGMRRTLELRKCMMRIVKRENTEKYYNIVKDYNLRDIVEPGTY